MLKGMDHQIEISLFHFRKLEFKTTYALDASKYIPMCLSHNMFVLSGKIALERARLDAERKDRERRFELESQERQVILELLKEKVLKG